MKRVFFIGRFQPFHMGHLHAIGKILKKWDFVIIGIGSSQEQRTFENPLSYDERKQIIEAVLEKRGFRGKYKIVPVPDFYDNRKWTSYCLRERFDVVVSGNIWTRNCFSGVKETRQPDFLRREELQATRIRKAMLEEEEWEKLVPEEEVELLRKLGLRGMLEKAKKPEKKEFSY